MSGYQNNKPEEKTQAPRSRELPSVLEAALHYAAMGYPVVPLEPGGKVPYRAFAPHGFKEASTNPQIIAAWFKVRPDLNVGIVPPDGVVGFDFDLTDNLEAFLKRFPSLRNTSMSETPRGGHVWAAVPEGVLLRSTSTEQLPRFELKRPWTGYLVEPPSQTPGGNYVWRIELKPPAELKRVPPHLLNALVLKTSSRPPTFKADVRVFERILSRFEKSAHLGNRHTALKIAVAALRLNGAPPEYLERLQRLALGTGLPYSEVRGVFMWGRRRLPYKYEEVGDD